MKTAIKAVAALIAICVVLVLAHLALIEIGKEVVVVHEPTPEGGTHRSRLWIVDEGAHSWIHPGNANARWWVEHMDANATVEVERGGTIRRYRALPDPSSHAKVHGLMRAKYGIADVWVRFLTGTDSSKGLITGSQCTTTPIRLEPLDRKSH